MIFNTGISLVLTDTITTGSWRRPFNTESLTTPLSGGDHTDLIAVSQILRLWCKENWCWYIIVIDIFIFFTIIIIIITIISSRSSNAAGVTASHAGVIGQANVVFVRHKQHLSTARSTKHNIHSVRRSRYRTATRISFGSAYCWRCASKQLYSQYSARLYLSVSPQKLLPDLERKKLGQFRWNLARRTIWGSASVLEIIRPPEQFVV